MATSPDERYFITYPRGHVRDNIILESYRQSLRDRVNPDTGLVFTEDEIRLATSQGTPTWARADAIDVFGQSSQARALFLATQLDPRLANTNWLRNYHAALWLPDGPLDATGGEGSVYAAATVGTIFIGSTTLGDPAAHTARDPANNLYQVMTTTTTPAGGVATLTMQAVLGGAATNPDATTVLEWVSRPTTADPTATVATNFSGGTDAETDAELANRVVDRIQNRPASGNNAQVRAWARKASNAVETAFVYACALHAGSMLVTAVQKRGSAVGSTARIPSAATLTTLRSYLTPPGSPVVPQRWHALVVAPTSQVSDLGLKLAMRKASAGGWGDLQPWPSATAGYPAVAITAVTTQTDFEIETDCGDPSSTPQLMVWNKAESSFEQLAVSSVTALGGGVYRVQLTAAASFVIATNDRISPYSGRAALIAQGVQSYYDALGTGEVIDLAADARADRAWRYPQATQEYPQQAGTGVLTYLQDTLGAALIDSGISQQTNTTPVVPSSPELGPALVTIGYLGVYPL